MTPGPAVVRVSAHAKANLFLRILAREVSGYHSIETLFTLLELADEISVETTAAGVELVVEGADTGPPEDNLATRAAALVLEATGMPRGVRIRLTKHIPVRAGLGGGSSDGAAVLHAVNALLGNPVPRHEILQLATRLGSDVAFFAAQAPLALGWGRGERLFRIPAPPSAPVLLAIPGFGVSTPEAYALVDATRPRELPRGAVVLESGAFDSWGNIGRLGGNDFETVLFNQNPGLRELFEQLAGTRPLLVRLSGSGSAIVAVYRTVADRDAAVGTVRGKGTRLIPTATRPAPPAPPAPE